MHDVTLAHDVVLAFEPQSAGFPRSGLAAITEVIIERDDFRADEAVFEIGVLCRKRAGFVRPASF